MAQPIIDDFVYTSGNGVDKLDMVLPSAIPTGNLILILVHNDDNSVQTSWQPHETYTRFFNYGTSLVDVRQGGYYLIADGSQGATATIRVNSGNLDDMGGWAMSIRNVDSHNPIDVLGPEELDTSGDDRNIAGVVTTKGQALAFAYLSQDSSLTFPPRHPVSGEGWNLFEERSVGFINNGVSTVLATQERLQSGLTPVCTVGVPGVDGTVANQFAIRPSRRPVVDGSLRPGGTSIIAAPGFSFGIL